MLIDTARFSLDVHVSISAPAHISSSRPYQRLISKCLQQTWDVEKWMWPYAAMTAWVVQILFLTSTCATKAAVLLFYQRLVKNAYVKRWVWAIWGALKGPCNPALVRRQFSSTDRRQRQDCWLAQEQQAPPPSAMVLSPRVTRIHATCYSEPERYILLS